MIAPFESMMQAGSLGATQNPGYSFRLLGGFCLLQGTFSCPLVPAANLGLDHARSLRCQLSLSLARLERSPARPEAERLGRSGGRASESTRSKHGGRTFAPQVQRGGLAESRGGLPLSQEDLEPRPWLLPALQRGSRTKKNAPRMPPGQRSDMGATVSTTRNQRKCSPKPLRPLNNTKNACGLGSHF